MSDHETTSELRQIIEAQTKEIEEYEKMIKVLENQIRLFQQFLNQEVKKEVVQDKVMDRDLTKLTALMKDVDFVIDNLELSLKRFSDQLRKLEPSLNNELKNEKGYNQSRLSDTSTIVKDFARVLVTFLQHLEQLRKWYDEFRKNSLITLNQIKKQDISATLENEKIVLDFVQSFDQFLNSFEEHIKNLEKVLEEHKEKLIQENKVVEEYDKIISDISQNFQKLDRVIKEFMNYYTSWLKNQRSFVLFILQKVNTEKKKEIQVQKKSNQNQQLSQNVQATSFTRTNPTPSFNIDVVKMEQARKILKERIEYLDKMIKAANNLEKHYNPFNFFFAYQKNFEAVYKNFVDWYQRNRSNFLATPDDAQYGRWLSNFQKYMDLEYNNLEKNYHEIMNKLNQYLPKIPQNEDVNKVKEAMLYESLKKHNIDLQQLRSLMESIYDKYNLDKKRLTGNVETFKFIFDKNILEKELRNRKEMINLFEKEIKVLRLRLKTLEFKKMEIDKEMKLVLKLQKEDARN
ncbi:MAG: hypothetical protein QXR30_03550 [Candidatus Woesearchaeota archaeon]